MAYRGRRPTAKTTPKYKPVQNQANYRTPQMSDYNGRTPTLVSRQLIPEFANLPKYQMPATQVPATPVNPLFRAMPPIALPRVSFSPWDWTWNKPLTLGSSPVYGNMPLGLPVSNSMAPNGPGKVTPRAIKPTGRGTVRQHGYHQHVINEIYGKTGGETVTEAAGTTEPVGPPYPDGGGGGGGGGGYPTYDYGAGSYTPYNNAFNRYQQGYGVTNAAPQAAMGARAVPTSAYSRNYATQNQAARWIQLLTNWRIG